MTDLRAELLGLLEKYPAVFTADRAATHLAYVHGLDRHHTHMALDAIIDVGNGTFRYVKGWTLALSDDAVPGRLPPLPLTDPAGVVRAWACPYCLHVGGGSSYPCRNADAALVEASLQKAEGCCRCPGCRETYPRAERVGFSLWCPDCTARMAADEPKGEWVTCETCDGSSTLAATGRDGATVSAECPDCEHGRVWQATVTL